MVSRLILGTTLSVALLFNPCFTDPAQAKSSKKKDTQVSAKAKKKGSKTYTRSRSSSSSSRYSSRAREAEGDTSPVSPASTSYSTPTYYRSSICETPPLMKITPQRDGKFLMEPMGPKRPGSSSLSTPYSGDRKPQVTVRDDLSSLNSTSGFMTAPRWNFNELVLSMAKYYQGAPYSRGSRLDTSGATDCSGFVQYIYQGFKINLPRSSSEQAHVGKTICQDLDYAKLLPGDVLFFRRGGKSVGHSGIYMGNGKMIHASNHRNGVTVTDLNQPYYQSTFVVAKRVFEVQHPN